MKKSITSIHPKAKKKERNVYPFLYVQLFLTFLTLILGVISIFKKEIFGYFELSLSLVIFDMGLNNKLIYKRAYLTLFYLGIGLFLFVLGLIKIIGG